jgi:hypothetical protein
MHCSVLLKKDAWRPIALFFAAPVQLILTLFATFVRKRAQIDVVKAVGVRFATSVTLALEVVILALSFTIIERELRLLLD